MSGILGTNYGEFAKQVKDPKKYDQNAMQAAADVGSGILGAINTAEEFVVPHAKRDPLNPMAYVKDVNEWFEPAAQMAIDESQGEAEYPGWAYGLAATPIIGKVAKPVAKAARGIEGAAEPLLKAMEKLGKSEGKTAEELQKAAKAQDIPIEDKIRYNYKKKMAEKRQPAPFTESDGEIFGYLADSYGISTDELSSILGVEKPEGARALRDDMDYFSNHVSNMYKSLIKTGRYTKEEAFDAVKKNFSLTDEEAVEMVKRNKELDAKYESPQLLADVPAEETVMENFLDSRFPFRKENKSLLSNADVSKSELLKSAEKGFNELIYSGRLNGRQEENVYKALKEGDVNKIVELANRYGVEL